MHGWFSSRPSVRRTRASSRKPFASTRTAHRRCIWPGLGVLPDAASLVDAFSGEGIGNAMASAEVASGVIRKAFQRNDLTASSLSEYDTLIQKRMGRELRTSHALQRLSVSRHLFDLIVGKAGRNPAFNDLLSSAFRNEDIRSKLVRPEFMLRLLFT